MDKQKAFDIAYKGIITQNSASAVPQGSRMSCRYKLNDKKCTIGHLIEDKDYNPSIEKLSLEYLYRGAKLPSYLMDLPLHFLSDLQEAHDHSVRIARKDNDLFIKSFLEQMNTIANHYGLQLPA